MLKVPFVFPQYFFDLEETENDRFSELSVVLRDRGCPSAAAADTREGNKLNGLKDVCLKNGSNQGQDLALTVLFLPNSLETGSTTFFEIFPDLITLDPKPPK